MPQTTSRPRTTGRHRRRTSGLAGRAAAVAGSTAVAALLATLPAAPAATRAASPAAPTATVTAPVVRVAARRPAALSLNTQAVAAAVPAAVRTSAMQKALGKIGAKYRFGASGPSAFDCSGLVNWAYRSSGTSLPRTSRALSRVGTPVSKAALQPGDLVFFYRGPSHVGIYVGNGKLVHASNPSHPVRIADLNSMPFSGARRV